MAFISALFVGSLVVAVLSFWVHGRLAPPEGRPGLVSMLAFAVGWLFLLSAVFSGIFLLTVLFGG